MNKRVILITGTPAVGKTTTAKQLAKILNAQYINLTQLAKKEHLTQEMDKQRQTAIIDENKMRLTIQTLIAKTEKDTVIDGHYAAAVTPRNQVTHVFVLRRHPKQLREFMARRGYTIPKQQENLEAEILDVCLTEALQTQESNKICELNVTHKTTEETLADITEILQGKKPCYLGTVDWLGILEKEGTLDEYLKP